MIAVNIAVFLVISAVNLLSGYDLTRDLGLLPSGTFLLSHPWTLLTYSLTQANVLQLFFNCGYTVSAGCCL